MHGLSNPLCLHPHMHLPAEQAVNQHAAEALAHRAVKGPQYAGGVCHVLGKGLEVLDLKAGRQA